MSITPPHNTEAAVTRQRIIENCLFENMKSKPYSQISISDMCRQMGISRRLYYTYFPDKDSCLNALVDRYVLESMECCMVDEFFNSDMSKAAVAYLQFWKENHDFLDVIVKANLKSLLIERTYLYCKENSFLIVPYLTTENVEADDSIIWLYCAIRFAVLLQWHESSYALPVEKMAVKYLRMLKQPIVQE